MMVRIFMSGSQRYISLSRSILTRNVRGSRLLGLFPLFLFLRCSAPFGSIDHDVPQYGAKQDCQTIEECCRPTYTNFLYHGRGGRGGCSS
jgi:hypothetical protein